MTRPHICLKFQYLKTKENKKKKLKKRMLQIKDAGDHATLLKTNVAK